MKACTKCGRTLPFDAFNRRSDKLAPYESWCRECKTLAAYSYRARHPEQTRRWKALNPEKVRAAKRRYNATHGDVRKVQKHRRDARQRDAQVNDLTSDQWTELVEECGDLCYYCGVAGADLQVEHMTPLSRGGDHTLSNVVPACSDCNNRKGSLTAQEFAQGA